MLLSVRASDTKALTEFCLATASVKFFFLFRDFFCSLLLNVVRAADENPDTASTVASGGLEIIPNPDSGCCQCCGR